MPTPFLKFDEISKDALLAVLQHHIGEANGITAVALVVQVTGRHNAPHLTRQIREVVTELRLEGQHICAHPESGYFMAATDEELTRCCQFLYERAMSSLQQIAAMKKVSLPDLRGQLHLPT